MLPTAAAPGGVRTDGAETARLEAVGVSAWQGSPAPRAYARRVMLPATAVGLVALAIGVTLMWLSFGGGAMFVYPLVGVLATALGVYGLFVRPVLVVRACRRVRYRIDQQGVEVQWSPEHKILIPADHMPPFSVLPAGGPRMAGERTGASDRANDPTADPAGDPATKAITDVLFAGPPAWVSPWGAWRIVDDTWGLVGLERPDEAIAALTRLRETCLTPTAWAEDLVTVPWVRVFVPWLTHLLRRLAPWRAR